MTDEHEQPAMQSSDADSPVAAAVPSPSFEAVIVQTTGVQPADARPLSDLPLHAPPAVAAVAQLSQSADEQQTWEEEQQDGKALLDAIALDHASACSSPESPAPSPRAASPAAAAAAAAPLDSTAHPAAPFDTTDMSDTVAGAAQAYAGIGTLTPRTDSSSSDSGAGQTAVEPEHAAAAAAPSSPLSLLPPPPPPPPPATFAPEMAVQLAKGAAVSAMEDVAAAVAEDDHAPPASFPSFPSLSLPSPAAPPAPADRSPVPRSSAETGLASLIPDMPLQPPLEQLPPQQQEHKAAAPPAAAARSPSPHPARVKIEEGLTLAAPASMAAKPSEVPAAPSATLAKPTSDERRKPNKAASASEHAKSAQVPTHTASSAAATNSAVTTKRKAASSKKAVTAEHGGGEESNGQPSSARKKKRAKHTTNDAPNLSAFAHPSSALAASAAAASSTALAVDPAPPAPVEDDFELDTQLPAANAKHRSHSQKKAADAASNHRSSAAAATAASAATTGTLAPASQSVSGAAVTECIICQQAATSHGAHRLCCIKCGHLFGHSCIKSWLSSKKECPVCKLKAVPGDIIKLFAGAVTVADTAALQSERDRVQALHNELVTVKGANIALQDSLKKMQARYEYLACSHQSLQEKVMLMKGRDGKGGGETHLTYIMSPVLPPTAPSEVAPAASTVVDSSTLGAATAAAVGAPSTTATSRPPSPKFAYTPLHVPPAPSAPRHSADFLNARSSSGPAATSASASSAPVLPPMVSVSAPLRLAPGANELQFPLTELFNVESGRCVDFDNGRGDILLSANPPQYPAVNGLSHGVMKLAVSDVRTRYFLPLHSKPIRDLRFHEGRQLLLSCGFDKTLKLSSMAQGTVVSSFDLPLQAWSCAWNAWTDTFVHVGLQTGELFTFDIRMNRSVPLFTLALPVKQPVHSIVSVGESEVVHGLIAATSSHVAFYKSSADLKLWELFDVPLLPPSGVMGCAGIAYDSVSSVAVCTTRPSLQPPAAASSTPIAASKPLCTVFRMTAGGSSSSSSAGVDAASTRPRRWELQLQCRERVKFDAAAVIDPNASTLACSCVAQLAGQRACSNMTRATIFSHSTAATASQPNKLLVACGDDEGNQCVIWDAQGERMLSRLNGQQAPITQVQHSSSLRLLASVSNQTCCLYSSAAPVG